MGEKPGEQEELIMCLGEEGGRRAGAENERMENWTIKRTHKQRADDFRGLYRRPIDFISLILS